MINKEEKFCSHCLLPLGSQPTLRTVNGEEHAFCCYGCCLAFQVRHDSNEEPEAAWLLVRLGGRRFSRHEHYAVKPPAIFGHF